MNDQSHASYFTCYQCGKSKVQSTAATVNIICQECLSKNKKKGSAFEIGPGRHGVLNGPPPIKINDSMTEGEGK